MGSGAAVRASSAPAPRAALKILAVTAVAAITANCSSQQVAGGRGVDPKYGVAPSPRVVQEGEPVPKGGGREMVGRPYQIAGRTYVPHENPSGYSRTGLASWYGSAFHGRLTANGEVYDRHSIAAAHTTLPLPSYVRITNLENRRSIIVRVNDRGPYHGNRLIDVSERVAEALDFKRIGTARVKVDYVGRASTRGSDDRKLLATLRTDGTPAPFPGATPPVLVAAAEPAPSSLRSSGQILASFSERSAREVAPAREGREAETEATQQVAAGIPLPPERPFDLGAAPNGAVRGPVAALLPPTRPKVAGLL